MCATITKSLNREQFRRVLPVLEIKLPSLRAKNCLHIIKKLTYKDFKIPIEKVHDAAETAFHKVFLDPLKVANIQQELTPPETHKLQAESVIDAAGIWQVPNEPGSREIGYEDCSKEFLLKQILPADIIISGYTIVGHIIHLNLKEEALPYKYLIGSILLDKVPFIKTVVNKLQSIDSTYRHFEMELLAGEENYITCVRENDIMLHMDFAKVYWNSRLGTEHSRIVNELQPGDVLYDACAGVGPFVIPAMKKHCEVLANDLNPESIHWLRHNIVMNTPKRLRPKNSLSQFEESIWTPDNPWHINTFNLDAIEFIEQIVIPHFLKHFQPGSVQNKQQKFYLVMNLPAAATEFLSALRLVRDTWKRKEDSSPFPLLHIRCYCFLKFTHGTDDIPEEVARQTVMDEHWCRIVSLLGLETGNQLDPCKKLRFVRNVSPGKDMFCASFALPMCVQDSTADDYVNSCKKRKVSEN